HAFLQKTQGAGVVAAFVKNPAKGIRAGGVGGAKFMSLFRVIDGITELIEVFGFNIGQVVHSRSERGRKSQRLLEGVARRGETLELDLEDPESHEGRNVIGAADHIAEFINGLVFFVLVKVEVGERNVGGDKGGVHGYGFIKGLFRLVILILSLKDVSQQEQEFRIFGRVIDALAEEFVGGVELFFGDRQLHPGSEGRVVIGGQFQGFAKGLGGSRGIAGLGLRNAEKIGKLRILWVTFDKLAIKRLGARRLLANHVRLGQKEVRFEKRRVAANEAFKTLDGPGGVVGAEVDFGQKEIGLDIVGVGRRGAEQQFAGLGLLALAESEDREVIFGGGEIGATSLEVLEGGLSSGKVI